MRFAKTALLAIAVTAAATGLPAQEPSRQPPRWLSIGAGRALMRSGPARTYPGVWMYQRAGLPLQVVGTFKEWRRVRDPDGAEGWMLGNLLKRTRTAIVRGDAPAALRADPAADATLVWRAAPGVVGKVSRCGNGWCQFDVDGKAGYVETADIWGVDPGETLP